MGFTHCIKMSCVLLNPLPLLLFLLNISVQSLTTIDKDFSWRIFLKLTHMHVISLVRFINPNTSYCRRSYARNFWYRIATFKLKSSKHSCLWSWSVPINCLQHPLCLLIHLHRFFSEILSLKFFWSLFYWFTINIHISKRVTVFSLQLFKVIKSWKRIKCLRYF